jgi:hypothetical protein
LQALALTAALDKLVGGRKISEVLTKQQRKALESAAAQLYQDLAKSTYALAHRDYKVAMESASAAKQVVASMIDLGQDVHFDLSQHFSCPHEPIFTGWWVGAAAALLLALIMFALKSKHDAATRSKWY